MSLNPADRLLALGKVFTPPLTHQTYDFEKDVYCPNSRSYLQTITDIASKPLLLVKEIACLVVATAVYLPYGVMSTLASFVIPEAPDRSSKTSESSKITSAWNGFQSNIETGFSASSFQNGFDGTSFSVTEDGNKGESNWGHWMKTHPENIQNCKSIEDVEKMKATLKENNIDPFEKPKEFAQKLKGYGATVYRVSFEWSALVTKKPKEGEKMTLNPTKVAQYKALFKALEECGITLSVTMHHFTHPQWLEEMEGPGGSKGFENPESVDYFCEYAELLVDTFPEIRTWMTVNEANVFAFEGYLDGVFPPGISGRVDKLATVQINLLRAHTKIYQRVQEKFKDRLEDPPEIGITHQWLRFKPYSGNFMEKIIATFLSCATHNAIYKFFQTGVYHLQLPFCNKKFTVNTGKPFSAEQIMDFIGVQVYGGKNRIKMGLNNGVTKAQVKKKIKGPFPGYRIENHPLGTTWPFNKIGFTFGVTCPPGGNMAAFGPTWNPEGVGEALEEALKLGDENFPLHITETGADAMSANHDTVREKGDQVFVENRQLQKLFFERVLPLIDDINLKNSNRIRKLGVWSPLINLEWNRGLGVVDLSLERKGKTEEEKMTPALRYLSEIFKKNRPVQRKDEEKKSA
jgi:beta-glucosidase/6-phospho-beta-glucosidase/beta-galactosidase